MEQYVSDTYSKLLDNSELTEESSINFFELENSAQSIYNNQGQVRKRSYKYKNTVGQEWNSVNVKKEPKCKIEFKEENEQFTLCEQRREINFHEEEQKANQKSRNHYQQLFTTFTQHFHDQNQSKLVKIARHGHQALQKYKSVLSHTKQPKKGEKKLSPIFDRDQSVRPQRVLKLQRGRKPKTMVTLQMLQWMRQRFIAIKSSKQTDNECLTLQKQRGKRNKLQSSLYSNFKEIGQDLGLSYLTVYLCYQQFLQDPLLARKRVSISNKLPNEWHCQMAKLHDLRVKFIKKLLVQNPSITKQIIVTEINKFNHLKRQKLSGQYENISWKVVQKILLKENFVKQKVFSTGISGKQSSNNGASVIAERNRFCRTMLALQQQKAIIYYLALIKIRSCFPHKSVWLKKESENPHHQNLSSLTTMLRQQKGYNFFCIMQDSAIVNYNIQKDTQLFECQAWSAPKIIAQNILQDLKQIFSYQSGHKRVLVFDKEEVQFLNDIYSLCKSEGVQMLSFPQASSQLNPISHFLPLVKKCCADCTNEPQFVKRLQLLLEKYKQKENGKRFTEAMLCYREKAIMNQQFK